jgi:quercetin dioxygenase-like cupin family protein
MTEDHTVIDTETVPAMETGHSAVRFIGTPEMIGSDSMSVMLGTVPPQGMVYLHSHAEPESFYILDGEMEVYQETVNKAEWTRVRKGHFVAIRSNVKHAWRNSSSNLCAVLILTGGDVYTFLRELCELTQSNTAEKASSPKVLAKIQELAAAHHVWIGSSEENSNIGLRVA